MNKPIFEIELDAYCIRVQEVQTFESEYEQIFITEQADMAEENPDRTDIMYTYDEVRALKLAVNFINTFKKSLNDELAELETRLLNLTTKTNGVSKQ